MNVGRATRNRMYLWISMLSGFLAVVPSSANAVPPAKAGDRLVVRTARLILDGVRKEPSELADQLRKLLGPEFEVEQEPGGNIAWRASSDALADGFAKGEIRYLDGRFLEANLRRPKPEVTEVALSFDVTFKPDGLVCEAGREKCDSKEEVLRVSRPGACLFYSGQGNRFVIVAGDNPGCSSPVLDSGWLGEEQPPIGKKPFDSCKRFSRKVQQCAPSGNNRREETHVWESVRQCVQWHQERDRMKLAEFAGVSRKVDRNCEEFLKGQADYYSTQYRKDKARFR